MHAIPPLRDGRNEKLISPNAVYHAYQRRHFVTGARISSTVNPCDSLIGAWSHRSGWMQGLCCYYGNYLFRNQAVSALIAAAVHLRRLRRWKTLWRSSRQEINPCMMLFSSVNARSALISGRAACSLFAFILARLNRPKAKPLKTPAQPFFHR